MFYATCIFLGGHFISYPSQKTWFMTWENYYVASISFRKFIYTLLFCPAVGVTGRFILKIWFWLDHHPPVHSLYVCHYLACLWKELLGYVRSIESFSNFAHMLLNRYKTWRRQQNEHIKQEKVYFFVRKYHYACEPVELRMIRTIYGKYVRVGVYGDDPLIPNNNALAIFN